jgi:hypothetical protein
VTVAGASVTANRRQFDDEASVYKADLITTGMDKDKKGSRHQLPVLLQVRILACLLWIENRCNKTAHHRCRILRTFFSHHAVFLPRNAVEGRRRNESESAV